MSGRIFTICTQKAKILLNLNHVSSVKILNKYPNCLEIIMAHEKNQINGGSLYFGGGDNLIHEITCNNEQDAQMLFNEIAEKMSV